MSTIQSLWQSIETEYNNGIFPDDQLKKIDVLVYSDDIENIRNGLTLMTTLAPEYLCRYLKLDGDSMVLRDAWRFTAPLLAERVLVEMAKGESMWQGLYESGAFSRMEHNIFVALGDVAIEDLSDSEKDFCVRMAKEMVRVSVGEFMMGTLDEAYALEKPRHKVTLTRDFLIGKYAVTQALWQSVMGSNPSHFKGANRPVEQVSWFDVVEFCNKLSELEGLEPAYTINGDDVTCNWSAKGYRLPTEAEWEYSARGGEDHKYAGSDSVDEVAWYYRNSGRKTHPVGQKKPNGFRLYDMSGNVDEWVWDWFGAYPTEISTSVSVENQQDSTENNLDSVENPTGHPIGSFRVHRGGRWVNGLEDVRASYRNSYDPSHQSLNLGFRICRFP